MSADPAETSHISSEDLAGYLDRRLDSDTVRRIEMHMAECAACRADLVQIRALLGTLRDDRTLAHPHDPRRRYAWLVAAALVAVAVIPLARSAERRQTRSAALRTESSAATRITVVVPDPAAPQRLVDPDRVVFTWRPVDGAGTYRITVTDSTGAPVFTTTTTDTSIVFPPSRALAHAGSYLWYVDALRSDGTTWSTGVQSFSTTR